MSSSNAFIALCKEFSFLQVELLQRSGNPLEIVRTAMRHLHRFPNAEGELSSESWSHIPRFLRCAATLLEKTPEHQPPVVLENLEKVHSVAAQYIGERRGDVNDAAAVLRAVVQLDKIQRRCYASSSVPTVAAAASPPPRPYAPGSHVHSFSTSTLPPFSSQSSFSNLLRPSYAYAYQQWHQQNTKVHTLSILSLLQGTAVIHADGFRFPPSNPDQRGLFPVKNRVQMEAKMQRCPGARDFLQSMKYMEMNRLDAGMCLTLLAELGFYDADVCNMCCEVLNSAHAMVTSQQLSQMLYSLGVLQHRHVYQRFFSSLLKPKECTAEGIRMHVMGLAMLQQPPHSETQLMDGIFLHALRGEKQAKQDKRQRRNVPSQKKPHSPATLLEEDSSCSSHRSSPPSVQLPYRWYVDVGYSLSSLDISHHKFKLMASRNVRGMLPKMSTAERCKFLYALGPAMSDSTVPVELQPHWKSKVGKALDVTVKMVEEIEVADGPQVMHALRFCGITQHPRLPPTHLLSPTMTESELRENPVEVLLRTWAQTPKEYIIHLAEQIDTQQLHSCRLPDGDEGAARQLARVVDTLAKACPSPSPKDQYRFASLCATIEHHVQDFSIEDLLSILKGLQVLSLTPYYEETVQKLLEQLCVKREEMTEAQEAVSGALWLELGDEKGATLWKEKNVERKNV